MVRLAASAPAICFLARPRSLAFIFSISATRNFRYAPDVQHLVEDFLQYLRHERGQAEHTQKTYAALLNKFTGWAAGQGLTKWESVELPHLTAFLQH